MRPSQRRLALLLACALLVPGCTFLKGLFSSAFRKPKLTFRSASLANASLSDATLHLTYTLENPNPLGLSLAQVDYALFVEGKQVVAGKPPNGLRVPAQGAAELVFPANVKFADIVPVVQVFLNQDFATYRAEGRIGVQTPIGVISFPLSHEDRFEVPKLPNLALGSPRITNLSLSGATLELPLKVTNRNSFPLPISSVGGKINIAGANVGSISTGDLGALEGKATREVNLPLSISFSGAAQAANALRSGTANVAFNGSVQSGSLSLPLNFSQNVSFQR